MDADFIDDIELLVNTPTQVESLQYSWKRAAGGIGLYMNMDKMEYKCFNQEGVISNQNGSPLKWVPISCQQYLINWRWYQYEPSKHMDSYQ